MLRGGRERMQGGERKGRRLEGAYVTLSLHHTDRPFIYDGVTLRTLDLVGYSVSRRVSAEKDFTQTGHCIY